MMKVSAQSQWHSSRQKAAWVALLCYAVLLLHGVLAHTANFFPQKGLGASHSPQALSWLTHPPDTAQPDCPVCHVAGSHPQVASGSGPAILAIGHSTVLLDRSGSNQVSCHYSFYACRAPPLG